MTRPPAITVKGAPNTIPAGTTLEVRTNEAIVSTHAEGRTYQAEIATEVVDDQKRSCCRAALKWNSSSSKPRRKVDQGRNSATRDAKRHCRFANVPRRKRRSQRDKRTRKNRKTAETVGGGAALGTLIGAAAGGGKGAVLGGLVGAAAGAAVQVLTQAKRFAFRLNRSSDSS